jgi:micrococcal nuclease
MIPFVSVAELEVQSGKPAQGALMRQKERFFFILILFLSASACSPPPSSPTALTRPPAPTRTGTPAGNPTTQGAVCISPTAPRQEALVTGVTDGDSIEVETGGVAFRVRYIGIDAPEMNGEPLSGESRAANLALVGGKAIVMIRDLSEADRYGRLLRYVFVDGIFVNRDLVRKGLARASYYAPDTACYGDLRAAEAEAKREKRGIWGLLGSPTGGTRTGAGCPGGCITPPAGCRIKGNISAGGEKIYHVPGGKYYDQTVIEPEKGERWFCTEAEAVAAGWRRSKV